MSMVYKIGGKPFAFRDYETANKFREIYTPLSGNDFSGKTFLFITEGKNAIYAIKEEHFRFDVYDTIEQCLKDFPDEEYIRFDNERKKIKASIKLESPIVFVGNSIISEGNLTYADVNLKTLEKVISLAEEGIKKGKIDVENANDDLIVARLNYKYNSSISPKAEITLKAYKQYVQAYAQTNEKLDKLEEEVKEYKESLNTTDKELI